MLPLDCLILHRPFGRKYVAGMDLTELRALVAAHCRREGRIDTGIPGLSLSRADRPSAPVESLYEPRLSVVVQGSKGGLLGERPFAYGEGEVLVTALHLPVASAVRCAAPERPFLALALRFSPGVLAELAGRISAETDRKRMDGLSTMALDGALLDPLVRLLRLLDRPEDIPVLAPLIEREITYRLLVGPCGAALRAVAYSGTESPAVGQAIEWMRERFTETLRIEDVARIAGLGPSAFHRRFKALTSMSPLQYQKRLRLQEARRQLLAGGLDAARVAYAVGYESPSQFSREYARVFGAPPRRDAQRLRP